MFSIVIPVYNAKASLERCVDSWLCQTRKGLDCLNAFQLLVNDHRMQQWLVKAGLILFSDDSTLKLS